MEGVSEESLERLVMFEAQRQKCAAEYLQNPHDPENLTKWGSALVELSHFQQRENSVVMVEDAVSKLEAALRIDPKRADTLWNLGNAHVYHGFLMPVGTEANDQFRKAAARFQDAYSEQPSEIYLKSLEFAHMAPAMHEELQSTQGFPGPSSSMASSSKSSKSDLVYDIMGWVVLAIGIVVWVGTANMKSPPK